ncbi:MAG: tryptophan-rich sensory protein [Longimicrobiales bacterium]|nr:tryptophan-rich sensory protein [Longimicrobiales bacterium]
MGNFIRLAISVVTPLAVGGLSGFATARGVQEWYPTLVKPSFNPPSWVFGPVWTLLYLMMGIAAFLVWQKGWETGAVKTALALFAIQLILNGLWSVLFFGLRMPGLAFAEILLLWVSIGGTMVLFWRLAPVAGMLLLPYEAWVTFAAVLNGAIWALNR